ncbi:MAG TPA: energy transducer TonB [Bdellovibrionales bacterium]|nr:energy transducer TonB [Bdellovibrionales bacterium]
MKWFLIISVVLHAALGLVLLRRHFTPAAASKGVVTVDFVRSVNHEPPDAPRGAGARKRALVKYTAAAAPAGPVHSAQESDAYASLVSALIEKNKIYPRAALEREEEGRVLIAVTIARDGSVIAAEIEEASPFSSLNEAALSSVRGIGRFPPLPERVSDPVHLHVPLSYRIQR